MSMNQTQTPGEHAGGNPAILSIISRLLQPDAVTDMGALGVGGLITQVVLKLQPVLDPVAVQNMFHAILIRLVSAKFSPPSKISSWCLRGSCTETWAL